MYIMAKNNKKKSNFNNITKKQLLTFQAFHILKGEYHVYKMYRNIMYKKKQEHGNALGKEKLEPKIYQTYLN